MRRRSLGKRVPQARAAAIAWLGAHSRAKLWEGMAVSKLVGHVSGGLSHICAQDGMEQQFVDTVLLHALACAYGVIVLLLQDGCGPTALGPHLHEEIDKDCAVVDLVNDYDFWAVVESRLQSLGVPSGPLIKVISPYSEPRQRQTHKKQCRTWGRWAWAWWLRRRGRRAVDQRKGGGGRCRGGRPMGAPTTSAVLRSCQCTHEFLHGWIEMAPMV